MAGEDPRVTVVMITHQRQGLVGPAVERLARLPERPRVIVVDNASVPAVPPPPYPRASLIRLGRNAGAAGRTVGVCAATTPYVAFCDDDSSWAPGALWRAADHLDGNPDLALVAARLLVGQEGRPDPVVAALRRASIGRERGLPVVLGFLACAAVVHRSAYLAAGGFHPRYLIGGEEALLACDLAVAGWRSCYADDVVAHHWPHDHDRPGRSARQVRNDCWTAWLRRPWAGAIRRTAGLATRAPREAAVRRGLLRAAGGLGWVLPSRRAVPPALEAAIRVLERDTPPAAGAAAGAAGQAMARGGAT